MPLREMCMRWIGISDRAVPFMRGRSTTFTSGQRKLLSLKYSRRLKLSFS